MLEIGKIIFTIDEYILSIKFSKHGIQLHGRTFESNISGISTFR